MTDRAAETFNKRFIHEKKTVDGYAGDMNDSMTDASPAEDDNQSQGHSGNEQPAEQPLKEAQPDNSSDIRSTPDSDLLLIDGVIFLRLPPL